MTEQRNLELDVDEMRHLVDAAMEKIGELINTVEEQPVYTADQADPAFMASLVEDLPEEGESLEHVLGHLFDTAASRSLNPISPGFLGYVPGGGLFQAAVADLMANTLNRYVGASAVGPGVSQIEANVIRWFCQLMGYPESAQGFLTSGGSLANWSAVVTAREDRLGEDFHQGTVYASDQVHHCVEKAARLAGIPKRNLRIIKSDSQFRLPPAAVAQAIEQDRADGLKPFLLVGSAGTTNTGAIDPLEDLADVARQEGLWFHVDGAYGGFFRLTLEGRSKLSGIEQADSIVLDPHKTLFLPYGTGALLVRNGRTLTNAHSSFADYMPPMGGEAVVDFCEISPELTRPFRGLRVWLPFKLHGVETFRQYLEEKLALARWIEAKVAAHPALELIAPAELSILAFAVRSDSQSLGARNAETQELLKRINERQRVYLTGTMAHGVFAIRIAVVAFRTHQERLDMLWEDLCGAIEGVGVS